MLDRSALYGLMRSAIGGGDPSTGITLENALDFAGMELMNRHPWPWKLNVSVTLSPVGGQDYIDLPDNFGVLRSVASTDGAIVPCTIEQIHRMRESDTVPGGCWYVAAYLWTSQATADAVPTPRLEIYPTPEDSSTPTLSVVYDRRWVPLDSDTSVPDMPEEMHEALAELARLKIFDLQSYPDRGDPSRAEAAISRAWKFFGGTQHRMGTVTGGALSRASVTWVDERPTARVVL